ncbi:MAG: hypoxanthine phosphoribosyltransferase [Nitrospirae bacterium]|nr:MAG: hypoxanthine phosphoribosyltransferase [Nitrospirota bacterium]
MEPVFGRPLITQEQIRARVRELGKEITTAYRQKDLVMIGVLKGTFAFFADLVRAIRLPLHVDFLVVKSRSVRKPAKSGKVKLVSDLSDDIRDRDVLLVEDIVDSGLTVQYLSRVLAKHRPRSLEICTLLSKPSRRQVDVDLRFVGFEIPDQYVVGYGMDYHQQYRNLPYLAVLDPHLVQKQDPR